MNDSDRINELKKKRFQLLHSLYKRSGGGQSAGPSTMEFISGYEIGESLGFDQQMTINILQYLKDEDLIEAKADPWFITITHWGIKEVEEAWENPDQPTEHFLPINVIQIGTMTNSQIQQASPGATQVVTINESEKKKLEEIIQSLKEQIDELELNPQERDDLEVDISTMETQMRSSSPKKSIIIEALKAILAGAAGSLLASGLLQQILTWIGS